MTLSATTMSSAEVQRFSDHAQEWWDPQGAFRALHDLMPLRQQYVLSQCSECLGDPLPLKGKRVLDMACGGGLMSEALAKLGADVVGVDASVQALDVARKHAQKSDLNISYKEGTAESLAKEGSQFDIIIAFEIVEHVENLKLFMDSLAVLLKPEGQLLVSTLNRTRRSFLLGVVAAEHLLRWVPAGTHDWDRFVKPSELIDLWYKVNIEATDLTGMVYKPLSRKFQLSKGNVAVNYFMTGKKCVGEG